MREKVRRLCGRKDEEVGGEQTRGHKTVEDILPEEVGGMVVKDPSSLWDANLSAIKWGLKPNLLANSLSFLPRTPSNFISHSKFITGINSAV